jgi:hypothetical protein
MVGIGLDRYTCRGATGGRVSSVHKMSTYRGERRVISRSESIDQDTLHLRENVGRADTEEQHAVGRLQRFRAVPASAPKHPAWSRAQPHICRCPDHGLDPVKHCQQQSDRSDPASRYRDHVPKTKVPGLQPEPDPQPPRCPSSPHPSRGLLWSARCATASQARFTLCKRFILYATCNWVIRQKSRPCELTTAPTQPLRNSRNPHRLIIGHEWHTRTLC